MCSNLICAHRQPKPALGTDSNAVLVCVRAAALNPVDYKLPMMAVNGKGV